MRDARHLEFLAHLLAQRARAAEELQAAAHFEQHRIGRLEAHARREIEAKLRDGIEQRALARGIARQGVQLRQQGQRGIQPHAGGHAGSRSALVASANHLATVLEIDHGHGLRPGQRRGWLQCIEDHTRQVQRQPELATGGRRHSAPYRGGGRLVRDGR